MAETTNTTTGEPQHKQETIALALSGGGFRATLFHLGVISFLRESGNLHRVRHICSVSGGSVLAAHLALNWAKYTSPKPQSFEEVSRKLIRFTQSNVRGRAFRNSLLWFLFIGWLLWLLRFPRLSDGAPLDFRTRLLQLYYGQLFRKKRLSELINKDNPDAPSLHILATSVTTGQLTSFSARGFTSNFENDAERRGESLAIARAVAASSAFPPAFPVVTLRARDSTHMSHDECLTDGGVYDNLGILQLKRFDDPVKLVSDASASFYTDPEARYSNVISRTDRSMGILMTRLAQVDGSHIDPNDPNHIVCRIENIPQESRVPPDLSQWLPRFRTDLDAFSDLEVRALVFHGYSLAREAWNNKQPKVKYDPWDPLPPDDQVDDPLKAGAKFDAALNDFKSSCRLRLWRWRNVETVLICLLLCFYVSLASFGGWRFWHTSSPNTMPLGVEIVRLSTGLKDQNDSEIMPGRFVMFTGTINTDNSRNSVQPHMEVSQHAGDGDSSGVVVVFRKPLRGCQTTDF